MKTKKGFPNQNENMVIISPQNIDFINQKDYFKDSNSIRVKVASPRLPTPPKRHSPPREMIKI
jgi:hypothetical protein